jgi:hypothetical protein
MQASQSSFFTSRQAPDPEYKIKGIQDPITEDVTADHMDMSSHNESRADASEAAKKKKRKKRKKNKKNKDIDNLVEGENENQPQR